MTSETIIGILVIISALFALLASIGLLRMPDLYTKMHAVSKAGAFAGSLLLILCVFVFSYKILPIIILNILFFYLTSPIAAQVLAQNARKKKVPLYQKKKNDLKKTKSKMNE